MGCATTEKVYLDNNFVKVESPEPIQRRTVRFVVVDGMQCLTQGEYMTLAEEMQDINRYLKQNKTIIEYYNKTKGMKEFDNE